MQGEITMQEAVRLSEVSTSRVEYGISTTLQGGWLIWQIHQLFRLDHSLQLSS